MPDKPAENLAATLRLQVGRAVLQAPATPLVVPASNVNTRGTRELTVLWMLFIILLVVWFLGMVSSYTLGGFIHVLLVLAVIALIIQLSTGRRPAA